MCTQTACIRHRLKSDSLQNIQTKKFTLLASRNESSVALKVDVLQPIYTKAPQEGSEQTRNRNPLVDPFVTPYATLEVFQLRTRIAGSSR